ncbi:YciE/YciF ferroxidase family protein [Ferruginibacter profundus]
MSENTPVIATLHNLLDYEASKFTSAEIQLKKSLDKWIINAQSLILKTILQRYLDIVKENIQKMEMFEEAEEINSISLSNRVMQAFIDETEEKLNRCADAAIKDACLLAGVQAINHYKISTYGTAAAFANALEMEKQAVVFHEAEVKEKQIDDRLSQLAAFEINNNARTPFVLPQ